MQAIDVQKALRQRENREKGIFLQRFFKTAKGQYAEGDKFLGLTVPETRVVVKQFIDLSLDEIVKLLHSPWHEDRLCALLIMVAQTKTATPEYKKKLYEAYLDNTNYINNWDLVDCSAGYLVGPFLEDKSKAPLKKLAKSDKLFERRIAMISTFHYIYKGFPEEAFVIADILLHDKHDLIQKAVGWMLREIGKRCSRNVLVDYLDTRYKEMPRTMLRYSIEHFPEEMRQQYLKGKIAS